MKKLINIILFSLCLQSYGQNLISSRQSGLYNYIYRITNTEAARIYRSSGNRWMRNEAYFHTLSDSFPLYEKYTGKLQPGHYLKVNVQGNELRAKIFSVLNVNVQELNNNTDLCIQVYDTTGHVVHDAIVKVKGRKLGYDGELKAYLLFKSNSKGVLEVRYKGVSSYFNLSGEFDYSPLRRFKSLFLYRTPFRYVWIPLKFIVTAPVITVRDFIRGEPYEIGNNLSSFWSRNRFFQRRYNNYTKIGYFVFNKPKYLPGDTVKFKAYIVNDHGRPINKTLDVKLRKDRDKQIDIEKITPARPGSYSGNFVLADSLGLNLDTSYEIMLKHGKRRTYASGSFRYEDYELKSIVLTVRPDSGTQIRGRKFAFHIRATDENGLNIQDGTIDFALLSREMHNQFGNNVFVKDTLFYKKTGLEQTGETMIPVPDSLFPSADISYTAIVKVRMTDNEYKDKAIDVNFLDRSEDMKYELNNDSILFTPTINGRPFSCSATISGTDRFGYQSVPRNVSLPLKEKINPYYSSYRIITERLSRSISVNNETSLISCDSEVKNDSLKINILNPRKLPFAWFLYKANTLESKGYGNSYDYYGRIKKGSRYFLSLVYLWSGKTTTETYDLTGNSNDLKIQVSQPALVYPGQKVRMDIKVTDSHGKPVENVDLTAFSYTGKFNEDPQRAPIFPDKRKGRQLRNNFHINGQSEKGESATGLDYPYWNSIFKLDTIGYYRFLYHKDEIRFFSYAPEDGITQFAPFVIDKGDPVQIRCIYIDRVPVYFNWVRNIQQPYSFRIDSGFHHIGIRTQTRIFEIDSVHFESGKKLIISINDLRKAKSFKVRQTKLYFSNDEKETISRYLFPFRNNFGDNFAYLKQGEQVTLLNAPPLRNTYQETNYQSYQWNNVLKQVGPVRPVGATLKVPGSYEHTFNIDFGFEFDFSPSVIKMRCTDKERLVSRYGFNPASLRFSDLPLSEKRILDSYNEYLFLKKADSARFNLPKTTLPHHGRLMLKIDSAGSSFGLGPMFIMLMSQDDAEKTIVYPGNIMKMENLDPGIWSVILFFRGEKYYRYDSIPVKPDGWNYSRLNKPFKLKHDDFSVQLNRIIEQQVYRSNDQSDINFRNYMMQVQRQRSLTMYSGEGRTVTGTVVSEDGPLPGVSVMIKGTTIGTITDLNGYYSLIVPYGSKELIFSFIGYKTAEVLVGSGVVNVSLEPEMMALQEVVVTAMGIQNTLMGRVAGVSVVQGASNMIRIRGSRSLSAGNEPLYIIDGVPFNGDPSILDPEMLKDIRVVKDESLISIYGSRAANGVIMISTNGMHITNPKLKSLLKGADYDSTFLSESEASGGTVRKYFRDYAYWKPDLVTDKNGEVSFEIHYPDDVTNWSSYVLAMNGKKKSGYLKGSVKSYKPLMARLYTPRFLIEGDSSNLIGKMLNYTADTVAADIRFDVNDKIRKSHIFRSEKTDADTLPLSAMSNDTIKVKYFLRRNDGYIDGEEKQIPVFRKGIEMTNGRFFVLNHDTIVNISCNTLPGEGKLYIQSDQIELIEDELGRIIAYSYQCNEQLASKLSALLDHETILKFNGKPFYQKMKVNKIIRALEKNQNADGCWGWWDRSETSSWVTIHALGALTRAGKMGYNVRLKENALKDYIIWKLESNTDNIERLNLLYLMSLTDEKIDYRKYISKINESKLTDLQDKFRLIELKQRTGTEFSTDSVFKYEKTTIFGNIYFGDQDAVNSLYKNTVQTTLSAYRILKKSSKTDPAYLERIRNFLYEKKRLGYWTNTYESASIVETILPDLINQAGGKASKTEVILSGSINRKVTKFPFQIQTHPDDSVIVTKKGSYPVYLTYYQEFWRKDPVADSTSFAVESRFENTQSLLQTGKPVKMFVTLKVIKDARFVMMEIPIPAGCTYDSKNGYFLNSCHTEFFRDHVAVFFDHINPGVYTYTIELLPRFAGRYTLNPVKASLMYFPTFSSNNAVKMIDLR